MLDRPMPSPWRSAAMMGAVQELRDATDVGVLFAVVPDEESEDDEGASGGRAARVPLETLGGPVVDPRLDMFRDFVNSLDMEKGSGGEGGGRRS